VEEEPLLDVVIVAYRSRRLLRECLGTLRAFAPFGGMTISVVDNASDDGTVEMVEREYPDVQLVAATENLGFSRANNLAIRGTNGMYVLLLNPDTRVTAGALDRCLEVMEHEPRVGICGCRLEREDGTLDHAARRSFPTPLSALGHFTGLGRSRRAPKALAAYTAPDVTAGPVDAVNGAFMLVRRAAFDEVGLLDEGYWMYMEDLDLCYRFAEAGWLTWYEPSVTVVHIKWGTSGRFRAPRLNYAFHYGMFRFYRKHYAPQRSAVLNAVVYAGIVFKFGVSLVTTAVRRRLPRAGRSGGENQEEGAV
jgi:GT2 family glycosyltransferase